MSDTQDLCRVHVWIAGRVQGVFFRSTMREQARAMGLTGWVRNAADGRVEAEIQGPPARVADMVEACRKGPPAARVQDVEVRDIPVVRNERGFDVVP